MKTLGLTGGIGMGKSAAADLLRQQSVPVVDTDTLARDLVQPGQPALREITVRFGEGILSPDGSLARDKMAAVVFSDPAARRELEQILHPRIREAWKRQLAEWAAQGQPLAVVVIPLLFETGAEKELDAVICVACSPAVQRERLLARGWTPAQSEGRTSAQWPVEKKIAASNYVIWTDASLDLHAAQLRRVLDAVRRHP